MHRYVDRGAELRLWAEDLGPADGEAVLLVAPANRTAMVWPEEFLGPLTSRHRVIRYDHRDTGQSGSTVDNGGDEDGIDYGAAGLDYGAAELAADAVAVLDAFDVDRAHVVGMALGGLIAQLLLLDHPGRLRSAVLVCTTALRAATDPELPGPDPAVRRLWAEAEDPRDERGELAWRLEHWRLLNGAGTPFDATAFRAIEERAVTHSGGSEAVTAHIHLDPAGLDRGAELACVRVPTLVVEGPADPVHPAGHAAHLAAAIPGSRLVTIPGMGHAIGPAVAGPLAAAVLAHIG